MVDTYETLRHLLFSLSSTIVFCSNVVMIIWQVTFNFAFPVTGRWHLTKGDFKPRASVLTVFSPFLGNITVITSTRFQGYWPQCHQWSVKQIALFHHGVFVGSCRTGQKCVAFQRGKTRQFCCTWIYTAFFMLSKFEEGRVVVQKFKFQWMLFVLIA